MKIFIKLFLTVTLASLVFTSCASSSSRSTIVWNENFPKENSVTLLIPHSYSEIPIYISSYNGINVDWKSGDTIHLPPGETELLITSGRRNDRLFRRTFSAGDSYALYWHTINGVRMILLEDQNNKTELSERILHRFPRSPKTILPGNAGSQNQTGETTVIFGQGIFAYNINGSFVYDDFYPRRDISKFRITQEWQLKKETLSAGNNTLNFNIYFLDKGMNVVITMENVELTYNFEAGKVYTIAFLPKSINFHNSEYLVALYEFNSRNGKPGSDDQLVKSWKVAHFGKKERYFVNPATGEITDVY